MGQCNNYRNEVGVSNEEKNILCLWDGLWSMGQFLAVGIISVAAAEWSHRNGSL